MKRVSKIVKAGDEIGSLALSRAKDGFARHKSTDRAANGRGAIALRTQLGKGLY